MQRLLPAEAAALRGSGLALSVTCGDRFPLLSPTVTSSPGAGEVGPQGDAFWQCRKVTRHRESRPLGEGGCDQREQTEGVSFGKRNFYNLWNLLKFFPSAD